MRGQSGRPWEAEMGGRSERLTWEADLGGHARPNWEAVGGRGRPIWQAI